MAVATIVKVVVVGVVLSVGGVIPSAAVAEDHPYCSSGDLLPFLEAGSNDSTVVGDEALPTHKIWRLNVPGSASSNLYKRVLQGEQQTWRQRLHRQRPPAPLNESDASGVDDGRGSDTRCGFRLRLRGCSASEFRERASFLETSKQVQHADYKHLHDVFMPRWIADPPRQKLISMTMVRDPFFWFMRTFEKKSRSTKNSNLTFMFAPTWRQRNLTTRPDTEVSIHEFAEKAFWKWNVFSRTLAGNFSGGKILSNKLDNDNITLATARALNAEVKDGRSSAMLELAQTRLLGMSFFGIFERIQDTMDLLAHSMCWDPDQLGFTRRLQRESFPALDPERAAEDPEAAIALINANNALDRRLYDFALRVFNERVQAMRDDQSAGIVCRFLDTGCYIEREEVVSTLLTTKDNGSSVSIKDDL